jgi:amidase
MLRVLSIGFLLVFALPAWSEQALSNRSIGELQKELTSGRLTSERLVQYYLRRIHAMDRQGPSLQAIISLNPDALADARALDRERREHHVRGPLHGIPLLIKDNIETMDHIPTTVGSLALADNFATQDAPVVASLRAAGAIILGKTNLSEWANFRSGHSISGWTAIGGLTRNPYVLDRTACGSSSGTAAAVAADFAPAGLGSETDGSIMCPSSMNGLVGLKPTLKLLSQSGIVPIAHSQDTAGPMARSVTDTALLMNAMAGNATVDYVAGLKADALEEKRIGVLRFKADSHPEMEVQYERALAHLRAAGAVLVEVETPDMTAINANELKVLLNEFKTGLNAYLAAAPASVRTRDLQQVIEFNRASPYELQVFGQDIFEQAQQTKGPDDADYQTALVNSKRLAGVEGLDKMLAGQRLDLLVAPTTTAAWRVDTVNGDGNADSYTTLAAVAGYPHLTVPMGQVQGLPVGLSFIGPPHTEALLLAAGYAYEKRTPGFVAPRYIASLESAAANRSALRGHEGSRREPRAAPLQ